MKDLSFMVRLHDVKSKELYKKNKSIKGYIKKIEELQKTIE